MPILHQASRRIIKLCLDQKSFTPLLDNKITFANIQEHDKPLHQVIEYIRSFNQTYKDWPNEDTLLDELDVELPEVDSQKFVLDEYTKYINQQRVASIAEEAVGLLNTDPNAAISKLLTVSSIQTPGTGVVSLKQLAETRYWDYREDKHSGPIGEATLWPTINEICGGWVGPSFNVVSAQPNIGKTWFSCISAAFSMYQGKKVLLVVLEDSQDLVLDRVESLVYDIDYKDLSRHKLRLTEEIKYRDRLTEIKDLPGDILVATRNEVETVADIVMLVENYKPDLVIVDASYRLKTSNSKSDSWVKIQEITEGLQAAANFTGLPWVATTQESTEVPKRLGNHARGSQTRGGKDFMIAATNLFVLEATEDQRAMNLASIHICKVKNFSHTDKEMSFEIHWDLKNRKFYERLEDDEISVEGLEY